MYVYLKSCKDIIIQYNLFGNTNFLKPEMSLFALGAIECSDYQMKTFPYRLFELRLKIESQSEVFLDYHLKRL